MPKKFQKRIEDFVCTHCNTHVKGNGYTNHCPNCLWSKHVDINPGDREADCQGMMKPEAVEIKNDKYIIHYTCQKCGKKHRVKSNPNDDFNSLLKLSGKIIQ